MARFLYTLSTHARVVIEDPDSMCLNVQHWLAHTKFFNAGDISFAEKLFRLEGIKCKLKIYYVCDLLDSQANICFSAAATDPIEARKMLYHIIPIRYVSRIKTPDFSADARQVVSRYESNETF